MPLTIKMARFDIDRRAFASEKGGGIVVPTWVVLPKAPLETYMERPNRVFEAIGMMDYELAAVFKSGIEAEPPSNFDQQDMYFVPFIDFRRQQRSGPDIYIYRARSEVAKAH
jgi:hypothetical protein